MSSLLGDLGNERIGDEKENARKLRKHSRRVCSKVSIAVRHEKSRSEVKYVAAPRTP